MFIAHRFLALVAAVLGLLLSPAQAQVCSLYSTPPSVEGENLFNHQSFSASTPILKTWTYIVDNKLRMAKEETNGGTVGYAWHNTRERIADGFISTFTFKVTTSDASKAGDGFTYFIQNDKITNLNGGTGSKLGAFGIGKSIAIRFDLCANRPVQPCSQQEVGLAMVNSSYHVLSPNPSVNVIALGINLADGNTHTVRVTYGGRALGESAQLKVDLDDENLFGDITVGDLSGPKLFNDRFAYFGFTASTSWSETADIDILSWKTDMVPSDSALVGYSPSETFKVEFGARAYFTVQLRDSCKRPIAAANQAEMNVTSTLLYVPSKGLNEWDQVLLHANVTNNMDGTFTLTYDIPFDLGLWDMTLFVNGVATEGMPWLGGVESVVPPPPTSNGFPVWALVLLILLILLIIAVLAYVLRRLQRYQKKLKDNAEFIEEGKQQAKLDRLEDGVKYQANPMVGTVDDLKDQLRKNEEELARLKALDELGSQQSYTIESLQKQRADLMEEMNRLKKEEQEEELKRKKEEAATTAGSRAKKEFGREQVN